jgi:uncharacterized protein (DUF433 family)
MRRAGHALGLLAIAVFALGAQDDAPHESTGPVSRYTGEVAMTFTRITTRPDVCTGKPCIRDLRFPVSRLLGLLASGQSREDILRAYPYLEAPDIDEALRYAASLAEDETIELTG